MKTLLLVSAVAACGAAGLVKLGVLPCPCEVAESLFGSAECATCPVEPHGLYLEARDATVWGGACHISAEADSQGAHAVAGWAFDGGVFDGVELAGVRVVVALQGSHNFQAHEVFGTGTPPAVTSAVWVDADSSAAREAALGYVRGACDLGDVTAVHAGPVTVTREGDHFRIVAGAEIELSGEALVDRSCCTMPESRWYVPLASSSESIVGNPATCRFEGDGAVLEPWAFEGENSAFVARFGEELGA